MELSRKCMDNEIFAVFYRMFLYNSLIQKKVLKLLRTITKNTLYLFEYYDYRIFDKKSEIRGYSCGAVTAKHFLFRLLVCKFHLAVYFYGLALAYFRYLVPFSLRLILKQIVSQSVIQLCLALSDKFWEFSKNIA